MRLEREVAAKVAPLVAALRARCDAYPSLPGADILIEMAVLVAFADGRIDAQEQAALRDTIQVLSGGRLTEEQLTQEISSCVLGLQMGHEAISVRLGSALHRLQAEEEGLRFGAAVAYLSRGLSAEERAVLVHIADAAGVSAVRLNDILRESRQQFAPL